MKLKLATLLAMQTRWRNDLKRLERAYVSTSGPTMGNYSDDEHETVRNLATAIAHIDGLINEASRAATDGETKG